MHSMSWVYFRRTKITVVNTHCGSYETRKPGEEIELELLRQVFLLEQNKINKARGRTNQKTKIF